MLISGLSNEGINVLYDLYDVTDTNRKTKQGKINYLVKEISGQFIDYFRFMMNDENRNEFIKACNGKKSDIDSGVISWLQYGFAYIDENNKIIIPEDIIWIIEDLFCH